MGGTSKHGAPNLKTSSTCRKFCSSSSFPGKSPSTTEVTFPLPRIGRPLFCPQLSGQKSHRAHPHQCDMNDLRFSFQFTPCRTRDQPCNLRSTNSYFCSRCYRRPASESGHINPLFQSFDALNVPNELLAQILIFCCPEPNTPQLVVTWICSRWRIIALGLWELWNCILLTFVLSVTICPSQV